MYDMWASTFMKARGAPRAVGLCVLITAALLLVPHLGKGLRKSGPTTDFVVYHPDFDTFLSNLKVALDAHQLPHRALGQVFADSKKPSSTHPACRGLWLEFGVHTAGTIRMAANWRAKHCPEEDSVHGFDTFTGLPEDWDGPYLKGKFSLDGNFPEVPSNVHLWKGLFSDSLPAFIHAADRNASGRALDVTYLHVDCDLYAGAADVLMLLGDRIAPGAIVVFDELVNYPAYREHEVKALWEWLHRSRRSLQVIGILGPLASRHDAVELKPAADLGGVHQSAAFIAL